MHRSTSRIGAVLALCALALTAAVATASARRGTSRAPLTARVLIRDISFAPHTVTIRRGGQVTWSWRDGTAPNAISHTVTSTGRARFHGADARSSGDLKVRFPRAGYYRYLCTIHVGMSGLVVVR